MASPDLPPGHGGIQSIARAFFANDPKPRAVIGPGGLTTSLDMGAVAIGPRGLAMGALFAARGVGARRLGLDAAVALHPLAGVACLAAGLPTVVLTYGGELLSPRIRMVARRVFGRASAVVAISGFGAELARQVGGVRGDVLIVPVGVDDAVPVSQSVQRRVSSQLPPGRILLCVARLEPHKGQEILIRALPDLPADVSLVLVGEGSDGDRLADLARRLGVAARVVFAGRVSSEELPAYYRRAEVFALMSMHMTGKQAGVEGAGIVLLEACAYGVPVVAAATGGIPETVQHDKTALLVDPEDPQAVVASVRRILNDESLANRLAAAGSRYVAEERSWTRFISALHAITESVVR